MTYDKRYPMTKLSLKLIGRVLLSYYHINKENQPNYNEINIKKNTKAFSESLKVIYKISVNIL